MKTPTEMTDALKNEASEAGARVFVEQGEDGYKRMISGCPDQERYEEALSVVATKLEEWGYDYKVKGRHPKRILFEPPVVRRHGFRVWYK